MPRRLWELIAVFAKLGTVSFGGPAAHVAVMEDEIVRRRQWLSREQVLDLLGATHLIPGPNALEMVAYLGNLRAGLAGLLVSAVSFTLPAAAITGVIAWAYQQYGALPQVEPFLHGIKPAVLAIIFVAIYRLARTALKNWQTALIGGAVAAATLAGLNEVATLLAGGLIGAVFLWATERKRAAPPDDETGRHGEGETRGESPVGALAIGFAASGAAASPAAPLAASAAGGAAAAGAAAAGTAAAAPLASLALFFLKVGAVLYGTGYVLAAYLEGEPVDVYGWLTKQQVIDAVAAGQITPGPLLTTATFVGYLVAGPWGAVVATVGIVLPGLIVVAITHPWIPRLRRWNWSARFLDAVNAASIGLTAVVTATLARASVVDWQSWLIALAAGLAVLIWRAPVAVLVLGGGVAGLLLR
jgi:chromate transporter